MLKTFWSSSELTIRTKIDLQVACIFSRLLHPCCRNVDNKSRRFQKTPGVRNGTLQEDTQSVLERQSEQQHCEKYSTQTLHDSRRGKAEEVTTVRAHLQDEWPATDEDTDAGNGGGQSTSWTTCKKMVWRHQRLVCSVCSLPEAVQLASDREKYTRIMALFPIMQKLQNSPYCKMLIQLQ